MCDNSWLFWHSDLTKFKFGRGSAPDPAVEAYDASSDPLVVVERSLKIP